MTMLFLYFQLTLFTEYKRNFLRLKKLVLIGGPDDDVIFPWKSRYIYCLQPTLLFR